MKYDVTQQLPQKSATKFSAARHMCCAASLNRKVERLKVGARP